MLTLYIGADIRLKFLTNKMLKSFRGIGIGVLLFGLASIIMMFVEIISDSCPSSIEGMNETPSCSKGIWIATLISVLLLEGLVAVGLVSKIRKAKTEFK
jgi:hypothetical protein